MYFSYYFLFLFFFVSLYYLVCYYLTCWQIVLQSFFVIGIVFRFLWVFSLQQSKIKKKIPCS